VRSEEPGLLLLEGGLASFQLHHSSSPSASGLVKVLICSKLCSFANLKENFNLLGMKEEVLGIGIRIHIFFGLPDPDPLVRGTDPDPSLFS